MNRKGYSTGFTWIFGLVTLFGIGVMYITFEQVFTAYLVPTIKNMANSSASNIDNATINVMFAGIDRYILFFRLLPVVLFIIVILYMFIAAVRKEGESGY